VAISKRIEEEYAADIRRMKLVDSKPR